MSFPSIKLLLDLGDSRGIGCVLVAARQVQERVSNVFLVALCLSEKYITCSLNSLSCSYCKLTDLQHQYNIQIETLLHVQNLRTIKDSS